MPQISSSVDQPTIDKITKLSVLMKRSFSEMVNILLSEAVEKKKINNNKIVKK